MTEAAAEAVQEIGLYVHWPYCSRICPYCDFNVARDRGDAETTSALVAALVHDLRTQAGTTGRRRLSSVYFGGGTPSLLPPDRIAALLETASALFQPCSDLEVTLEANPTDAEAGRFAAFRDAGVTRLSLGVQALDNHALAFLGRNHDAGQARRAAAIASSVFPRLSVDLIYGRPQQSVADWRAELADALTLGAEHISAYQLTIEPGTAFAGAVGRGRWAPPAADLSADLFEATVDRLGGAGFDHYEVSNFARGAAARSRHNLTYWNGGDYLGVGPGAHGRVTDEQGGRWATRAAAGIGAYASRVRRTGCGVEERTRLSRTEAAVERLLMGLRTSDGVSLAELEPLRMAPERLAALSSAGLVQAAGGRIKATARGRLVLDRITLDLAPDTADA